MQLTAYSVSDVFMIEELDEKGQPFKEKLDLLERYSVASLNDILVNSQMYSSYGDDVTVKNLVWTKELVLGSHNKEFRTRIETPMASFPIEEDNTL